MSKECCGYVLDVNGRRMLLHTILELLGSLSGLQPDRKIACVEQLQTSDMEAAFNAHYFLRNTTSFE